MRNYSRALTIAGSDSGGGAGIQADLKTFSALGCYGMSVITALTAQNTMRVSAIYEVPASFVAAQIDAVLGDIGADAVKIGMLQTAEVVRTVAERLRAHDVKRVVLDPVMVAKSGDKLLQDDAVDALRDELLPLAEIVTPNLSEASVLTGATVSTREEMEGAAHEVLTLGARSALIKGGHLVDAGSSDVLCLRDSSGTVAVRWYEQSRSRTGNTHGTGCTLSSAIAAFRAQDIDIQESVARAKEYITNAIRAGAAYRLGSGHGPVHHFHNLWKP
ncbi:MAG: bifunctional hydroxymethylpyrimidine kinase/phosphomethylpyrimidine kinase [Bacteroidetes bacterium]|nr:bifunctional hydroxymethylpyrimidine kinase/phosphomethylpyrimidine kinase [Bacteroidota bacterium]